MVHAYVSSLVQWLQVQTLRLLKELSHSRGIQQRTGALPEPQPLAGKQEPHVINAPASSNAPHTGLGAGSLPVTRHALQVSAASAASTAAAQDAVQLSHAGRAAQAIGAAAYTLDSTAPGPGLSGRAEHGTSFDAWGPKRYHHPGLGPRMFLDTSVVPGAGVGSSDGHGQG